MKCCKNHGCDRMRWMQYSAQSKVVEKNPVAHGCSGCTTSTSSVVKNPVAPVSMDACNHLHPYCNRGCNPPTPPRKDLLLTYLHVCIHCIHSIYKRGKRKKCKGYYIGTLLGCVSANAPIYAHYPCKHCVKPAYTPLVVLRGCADYV